MKTTLGEIVMCKLNPEDWYLPTGFGAKRITDITQDYWVMTGKDLNRRSFCCHPNTVVFDNEEEAEKKYLEEKEIIRKIFDGGRDMYYYYKLIDNNGFGDAHYCSARSIKEARWICGLDQPESKTIGYRISKREYTNAKRGYGVHVH